MCGEWAPPPVGDGEPTRDVRVAGDDDLAAVNGSMMRPADTREVPGVGGAAIFPVAEMMDFDAAGGAAAGDDTRATVAVLDRPARVVGHGAMLTPD